MQIRLFLTMTFLATSFFSSTLAAADAEPLFVGAATTDITPPEGYRMSGYFYERLNEGIKDPLQAKALYFGQGDVEALFIACDLVGMELQTTTAARRKISEQTGIPTGHIAITATHTHTGPLYFGALRNRFHKLAVERDGEDKAEKVDYPKFLTRQLIDVTWKALENRKPSTLRAGYGHEDRVNFNRRFHMKNGTVRFNPGVLNPNIIRPAGPIDPEIGILLFDSTDDNAEPHASLLSFPLHLDTVGGTKYSADYPFYLQQTLQDKFGEDFTSVFGIGTCGDINHVNVKEKHRLTTEEIGTMLSESILKAIPDLKPASPPSLAIRSATLDAPKQQYSPERLQQAEEDIAHVADGKVPFLKRVETYKILALQLYPEETIPVEVQAIRLAPDVAIVTLPGEVFVELGMQIKQESPFQTTLVVELTNAAPGYIPTQKAFAEGSYETVNSRVVPGEGEKMAELAIRLLKELKPE